MRKSKLNIVRNEKTITIKKKTDIALCIIFLMVFISGILLPIIFEELRDIELFWVVLTLCMLTNITTFTSVFFGKIVIDSSSKEISIYYLRRDTYRFDDIKELKAIYQSGDGDGGMDTHKVLFIFTNGRKIELRTASQVQTEELIALLNSIVFNKNYLE